MAPPMIVTEQITILMVSWNYKNFLTLSNIALPHMMALQIETKLLSRITRSELSLETSQPYPMQKPTSAILRA